MNWPSLFVSFLLTTFSGASFGCRGTDCNKFKCSSDPFLPRPVDPYLRPGATFTSPCSCQPDWSDIFCNLTQALLTTPQTTSIEHPTVCICRKFSDVNSRCDQFISRCFSKKNKECTCCFNQPIQHCNQLSCKNGEPDFGAANTTCVCHHNPTDYPYQICKTMFGNDGARFAPALAKEANREKEITLLGVSVPINILLYVVLGLLLAVAILTILMLIAGNRKLRRRREDTTRQHTAAQEALLLQRADEDRYLPTV